MIIGFQPQFKPRILEGSNIHTIREDESGRWKPGQRMHMACGVRTKFYACFTDQHICKSIQEIEFRYHKKDITIAIDGKLYYQQIAGDLFPDPMQESNIELLARNDGFEYVEEFLAWFNKSCKRKILHWSDFKY